MSNGENEKIEYKRSFAEKRETIISLAAFATSTGGEVLFEVAPDGERIGIQVGRTN